MKIVVLDGRAENPGDLSWDAFHALGELTVYEAAPCSDAETVQRIGDAEIVITNKTPLGRAVLEACPSIRYIGLLSTGTNVCDCAFAARRGIPVCNVPAYSTAAVAQHTVALLLEITNAVGLHSSGVHAGKWVRSEDFCYWDQPVTELAGRTIGILGFGSIGKAVGRIAKALGMTVLAAGSRPTAEGCAIAEYVSPEELFARADVISLNCPLLPETEHIINAASIAKMRDGVILLNTGRGALVDERALRDALDSGKVAAAGVDVLSEEPMAADNPLLGAPNCYITPHIAWAAQSCRERVMEVSAENLRGFLTGRPQNVVNL